jgi:hypothetical protein
MLVVVDSVIVCCGPAVGVAGADGVAFAAVGTGETVGVGEVHPDNTITAAIAIIAMIIRLMTLFDCIVIDCNVDLYTKYSYRNFY